MDQDSLGTQQMVDVALVHATRREIQVAIAALEARPFDEDAATRMRCALRTRSEARAALRRLDGLGPDGPPGRPVLALISGSATQPAAPDQSTSGPSGTAA